jgi:pimeloyl-ACP methyl ester carboxylesterase
MPLSKTSTGHLFGLAKARGKREDLVGTALWRYSTSNPKGKILLIHGFRGNHHGLSAIAAALEEYEVLIPDLPGYGKSEELFGSHDLQNYGRWLADLYSELDPETMVLGHSFGSLVVGWFLGWFAAWSVCHLVSCFVVRLVGLSVGWSSY